MNWRPKLTAARCWGELINSSKTQKPEKDFKNIISFVVFIGSYDDNILESIGPSLHNSTYVQNNARLIYRFI